MIKQLRNLSTEILNWIEPNFEKFKKDQR